MAGEQRPLGAPADALPRVLGVGRFAMVLVAITIGTAIFRVPSVVAANAGSTAIAIGVWVVGGVFAFAGGLAAAEVTVRYPRAGGEYALLRTMYGERTAFVYGWTWLLLVSPASIAAVARTFADYAGALIVLSEWERRLITVVVIAIHAALAMASTRIASRFVSAATVAKLLAMGAVALAAFVLTPVGPPPAAPPLPESAGSIGLIIAAMVAVIWAYDGTAQVTMAGDTRDPARTIPRGLILAAAIVVVVYLVMVVAYQRPLGFQAMAASQAVAADAMGALVGPRGAALVAGLVMLSAYSCGMAQLVSHPRVTFALSADGMFFARFATLSAAGTPWIAVALHALLAAGLALAGGYEFLFRLVVFAFYPLAAMVYIGAIVLRRRDGPPTGFRMPFYPWPIIIYSLLLGLVLVVSLIEDPLAPLYSAAVLAAGWLVHRFVVRKGAARP
jgi:APA family basic amino acid/polyamine antiporter